jgi:hypothetical protein
LKLTPRRTRLSAVTALVLLVGAAIVALPAAFAEPLRPTGMTGHLQYDRDAFVGVMWPTPVPPTPSPTLAPTPSPTPSPTETLSPTASPTPTPTRKPTPKPKPKPIVYANTVAGARAYVRARLGTRGYNCVNAIWAAESKWNPRAGRLTGAYGIPQAFPGSKMAKFGSNWQTSPLTQVKWGIWYVNDRYGSACAAYTFWHAHGWY